jgi:hypothetical protein
MKTLRRKSWFYFRVGASLATSHIMQKTHPAPLEAEFKDVGRALRRLSDMVAREAKKAWFEDLEPKLVELDQTAETLTERTYRVAKETLRDVFRRHPKHPTS